MFDTFFESIRKSKIFAKNEIEKRQAEERASLMIHNFIFFMKAKIVIEKENNKKEKLKIYEEAGKELTKSLTAICSSILSQSQGVPIIINSKNLFDKESQNFLARLFSWFVSKEEKEEVKRKEKEFFLTLERLIIKLDKKRDIIGKSNLIAGIIENYKDELIKPKLAKCKQEYERLYAYYQTDDELIFSSFFLILLSGVIMFLRWIWHLISDNFINDISETLSREGWITNHLIWTGVIVGIILGYYLIKYIRNKHKRKILEKEYELRKSRIHDYYDSLILYYEE